MAHYLRSSYLVFSSVLVQKLSVIQYYFSHAYWQTWRENVGHAIAYIVSQTLRRSFPASVFFGGAPIVILFSSPTKKLLQ